MSDSNETAAARMFRALIAPQMIVGVQVEAEHEAVGVEYGNGTVVSHGFEPIGPEAAEVSLESSTHEGDGYRITSDRVTVTYHRREE